MASELSRLIDDELEKAEKQTQGGDDRSRPRTALRVKVSRPLVAAEREKVTGQVSKGSSAFALTFAPARLLTLGCKPGWLL